MFWKKKKLKEEITELGKLVKDLAESLIIGGNNQEFKSLAAAKAKSISTDDLEELKGMFHNPPKEGAEFRSDKLGLGGWMSACQFSIFELVYNLGEKALPFIREIAWGEYDWTQGNAIELLIRFASEGIKREEIINEIKENYPNIRYEAQLYAIQPLVPELSEKPHINSIFDELMVIEDFRDSYDELVG